MVSIAQIIQYPSKANQWSSMNVKKALEAQTSGQHNPLTEIHGVFMERPLRIGSVGYRCCLNLHVNGGSVV